MNARKTPLKVETFKNLDCFCLLNNFALPFMDKSRNDFNTINNKSCCSIVKFHKRFIS